MFDVSIWEIAVVFVVLLLVLGPKRLPHAAKIAGIWLGKMRRSWENIKHEIDQEISEKKDAAPPADKDKSEK